MFGFQPISVYVTQGREQILHFDLDLKELHFSNELNSFQKC